MASRAMKNIGVGGAGFLAGSLFGAWLKGAEDRAEKRGEEIIGLRTAKTKLEKELIGEKSKQAPAAGISAGTLALIAVIMFFVIR